VLDALGETASEIRGRLGESLTTVQKYDTALAEATTPSLEALKAFSSGKKRDGKERPDSKDDGETGAQKNRPHQALP
jgi:eukaryotic-like serine/threonine-protein kinase